LWTMIISHCWNLCRQLTRVLLFSDSTNRHSKRIFFIHEPAFNNMSRSIHTTWKEYWEKQRYQYSDHEQQANELEQMRQALIRKRAIKRQRKSERKLSVPDILPKAVGETVHIEVCDQGEYVHYPLTESDLRALLEILPPGIINGLASITFCLGKEYMKEYEQGNPDPILDPYTGRIADTGFTTPGVFIPPVLGSYDYKSNRIFIYAYVYDCSILKVPIIEFYLKLRMLNTFLHELAHHEDNQYRIARGRWLGSYDTRVEDYAYQRQKALVSEALMEVIHNRYGAEQAALVSWIETNGGSKIPIGEIIKGGMIFTAAEAVEELFTMVLEEMPAGQTKYHFANHLLYGGYYEEALSILKVLLMENPQNLEAKSLMADIYRCQKDYDRAEATAGEVLAEDPNNEKSIFVLSEVYFAVERWSELIDMTERGQDITQHKKAYQFLWYLEKQLLAHLFLGNYDQAKQILDRYTETRASKRRQQAFKALMLLATDAYIDATMLATNVLSEQHNGHPVVSAVAKGVFNAASSYLGYANSIRKLTSKDRSVLRNSKIGKLPFMKAQ
jgi:tetratricopeptide (TPR) repeat protein